MTNFKRCVALGMTCIIGLMGSAAQAATSAPADSLPLTLSTGFDYSTGKYGQTVSTDITYIPIILKYEASRDVSIKVTVPYLKITGPANVIGGIDSSPIVTRNAATQRRSASGLGDVVLSTSYALSATKTSAIDLIGKVKVPTADDTKGLGTGKTDYAVQLDGFSVDGPWNVFGSAGYRFMGSPAGVSFNNVPYYSIGSSYNLSPETSLGVAYDYRRPVVSGRDAQQELSLLGIYKIDRDLKLQGYYVAGRSNTSPDKAVGLVISKSLN